MNCPSEAWPDLCELWPIEPTNLVWRVHCSDPLQLHCTAVNFNPGKGPRTRFAPIWPGGILETTMYVGLSEAGALLETVFHDVPDDGPVKQVFLKDFEHLSITPLVVDQTIQLAALFGQSRKRCGCTQSALQAPPSCYEHTAAWAEALHEVLPSAMGVVWMSRQLELDKSLVLFGGRLTGVNLFPLASTPLSHGAGLQLVSNVANAIGADVVT